MTTLLNTNQLKSNNKCPAESEWINRHTLMIRLMHWINVICFTILLMSGLNIFNSNSMLFWGKSSYNGTEPLLRIKAEQSEEGNLIGITTVFGHTFDTGSMLFRTDSISNTHAQLLSRCPRFADKLSLPQKINLPPF